MTNYLVEHWQELFYDVKAESDRRKELLRRITKTMEDNPGWYAHDIYEEYLDELAKELES